MARSLVVLLAACLFVAVAAQDPADGKFTNQEIEHVLLISIDGLHVFDVDNFLKQQPNGGLAKLVAHGYKYTNAFCPKPSDSFPGMLALITGGFPRSVGVYYDDAYDRSLYPVGDYECKTQGAETAYAENVDKTKYVITSIDANLLPRKKLASGKCLPLFPNSIVRTNTVFEVLKSVNKPTAWSDKHPAYQVLQGPSGKGIDDLYTPEINNFPNSEGDQEQVFAYDSLKVFAINNQINGQDSRGFKKAPVPTLFGMNFQALSVIQKNTANGGYVAGTTAPNNDLQRAIAFIDQSLDSFYTNLKLRDLLEKTAIIVTSKHGQSPVGFNITKIAEAQLEAVISKAAPGEPAFIIEDDVAILYLADTKNTQVIVNALTANKDALGIQTVLSGKDITDLYGPPTSTTPDIIAVVKPGVVYTHSPTKTAEHGGFGETDTHVGLVVSATSLEAKTITSTVRTAQVAPTMLSLLNIPGASPSKLTALKKEVPVTTVLPTA